MGYKVITAASSPVIPLADLRLHLRLDLLGGSTHPDDALIEGYLGAAKVYCEHYTQRRQQGLQQRRVSVLRQLRLSGCHKARRLLLAPAFQSALRSTHQTVAESHTTATDRAN